ncbi:MAG: DUF4270 family protein, partial [Ginsengibacter sp.]
SGLLPAVDNINTFDTVISVIVNNFDSVFKDCAKIFPSDDHVLGTINNDPYFGTTTAKIFAELKPDVFPFKLPAAFTNITLDSVVLVLSYHRLYGDSTLPQKVDIYKVSPTGIKFDSSTSTCTEQSYDPLLLGSAIYIPQNLKDTVKGFHENSPNELRVKLNNSFAQYLLSQDSASAFGSDSLFKVFFKGFAIVPDVSFGGNALTYYNIADTNTKLAFYFRYPKDSKIDTTVINFRLNNTSVTGNNIVRNHTGAEITNHVNHPASGDDFIYIQTTPGTYAELKIPGLTGLSNRIIHNAELIMEQVYSPSPTDGYFTAPGLLYLEQKITDTTYRPIPCDFNLLSGTPNFGRFGFGGNRTTSKDFLGNTISTYTFNISRYVQKIVTKGITNYTLKLSAPNYIINRTGFLDECGQGVSPFNYLINNVTVGRVKLGGGNNPNYLMRLRIIYSNI